MLIKEDSTPSNAENTEYIKPLDNGNGKKSRKNKNQQKNHQCQYCERALPSQSLLATHIRVSFISFDEKHSDVVANFYFYGE